MPDEININIATANSQSELDGGLDPRIVAEAKTKNSPAARVGFFNRLFSAAVHGTYGDLDSLADFDDYERKTSTSLKSVRETYSKLFGREITADVPEMVDQFSSLNERFGDEIPQRNITRTLGVAEAFASDEQDKLRLE